LTTGPTNDEPSESGDVGQPGALRRRIASPATGWALWGAIAIALAALVAWAASDVLFGQTVVAQKAQLYGLMHPAATVTPPRQLGYRVALLWGLTGVGAITLFGIFVALFVGAARHRSLRSWFAYTLLVAAWLMLLVAWPEIAWQGQRLRSWSRLGQFDALAGSLRDDWPVDDGNRLTLGSYMAYPKGKPRALLTLKSGSTPAISAVERTDDGALRFELRGAEPGTWLEWQPAESVPHDFTGGLDQEYRVQRYSPLGHGWYLVRYQ
jgi:hypothetical protein